MLKIENLTAGYNKQNLILKGINLNIEKGQVVCILGRNGSGKSTLAKAICGLVPYVEGDILLNSTRIIGLATHVIAANGIGFFHQGGRVFPNLTVTENMALAANSLNKQFREKRMREVSNWFEILQKKERSKLKSSYLSGGEKHQLALAMVLVQMPKFLILDEPSAGLSPTNKIAIYKVLKEILQEDNLTIMLIEQNVEMAKRFANTTLHIINGELKV